MAVINTPLQLYKIEHKLFIDRLVGGRDGKGLWEDGIDGLWTGKMRSHCGMEGGGGGRECGTGKGATRGKGGGPTR